MEFNQLVFNNLGLIFKKHNLNIIEQFKNYVKLRSDKIIITFSHNDRENSNALYVGIDEDILYPIDEHVLRNVFNSYLQISYVTQEVFVNSLAIFFEAEGKSLIAGNINALESVEKYIYKEGRAFTEQLIDKQNLDAADKAWEEENYKDFIKYLDKMDRKKLPAAYDLKYKIAHQRVT